MLAFSQQSLLSLNFWAASRYGVLKENDKSIQGSVFIVHQEGKLAYAKQRMPSEEELLDALKSKGPFLGLADHKMILGDLIMKSTRLRRISCLANDVVGEMDSGY